MTTDVDGLKRLAEAATPGPWTADYGLGFVMNEKRSFRIAGTQNGGYYKRGDLEFMTAANPQTILSLLSEHAALKAEALSKQAALEILDRMDTGRQSEFEALKQEVERLRNHPHRPNIEQLENGVAICWNLHEKG